MQIDIALSDADIKRIASEVAKCLAIPSHGRDAFSEAEAAERIGVEKHVLRDRRLRGEISARKIGRKWYYSPEVLRDYVSAGRTS